MSFDLILRGGQIWTPGGLQAGEIGIRDGRIAAIGSLGDAPAGEVIQMGGLVALPGVIDSQVHFREPGMEHKEDLESGTASAAMGGVTAVFEMPNTNPLTTTAEAIQDKLDRAAGRAWVDHAFYLGGTANNAPELWQLERTPGVCGIKVFMGASFGDLLTPDDKGLEAIMLNGTRRIAIHAEDEPRLRERKSMADGGGPVSLHPEIRDVESAVKATKRALALSARTRRRIHILHVTTAEEVPLLAAVKDLVTMEVTPQHLTLAAPDAYDRLGSRAQMNPPIREERHREALWKAVREGIVDVIGSDHAPHTLSEKEKPYPESPSGMPGVQTLVPVMLTHVMEGRLSLARFVDLTSAGPQRIFGIAGKGRLAVGYDADITLVDLKAERVIEDSWVRSRVGWTPFAGMTARGWPRATIIRGHVVMRDDELLGQPIGQPVRFEENYQGVAPSA